MDVHLCELDATCMAVTSWISTLFHTNCDYVARTNQQIRAIQGYLYISIGEKIE